MTDFNVPNANSTVANSVNDNGVIVGFWQNTNGNDLAFERDASGNITTFSAPNPNLVTDAVQINNSGRIVGAWEDLHWTSHGFLK